MKKLIPRNLFLTFVSSALVIPVLRGAEQIIRPRAETVAAGLVKPIAPSPFTNQNQLRGEVGDELVVVVNKNNPIENLTLEEVRKYLLGIFSNGRISEKLHWWFGKLVVTCSVLWRGKSCE